MTALSQIVYENGKHWVKKLSPGRYEVFRNELTCAVRCGQINFPNDEAKALKRAIAECDRRESI